MPNTLRKVGSNLLKVGSALNIWDGTGTPCCCGSTACTLCDGFTPLQMQVVLDGILDIDGTGCFDCVNVNGTYVLDLFTTSSSDCIWQTDTFDLCGVATRVRLSINYNTVVAGQYTLRVQLQRVGTVSEWRISQVAMFDCDSFSSLDVPPFNEVVDCDIFTSPSTCEATAL